MCCTGHARARLQQHARDASTDVTDRKPQRRHAVHVDVALVVNIDRPMLWVGEVEQMRKLRQILLHDRHVDLAEHVVKGRPLRLGWYKRARRRGVKQTGELLANGSASVIVRRINRAFAILL